MYTTRRHETTAQYEMHGLTEWGPAEIMCRPMGMGSLPYPLSNPLYPFKDLLTAADLHQSQAVAYTFSHSDSSSRRPRV